MTQQLFLLQVAHAGTRHTLNFPKVKRRPLTFGPEVRERRLPL